MASEPLTAEDFFYLANLGIDLNATPDAITLRITDHKLLKWIIETLRSQIDEDIIRKQYPIVNESFFNYQTLLTLVNNA